MSKARILANLISDNAELADGQISVAEVVGAAPLASPTFTGTASGTFSGPLTGNVVGNLTGDVTGDVTAPEIDLTAISSTIADTAVDVFVYDTSLDSDSGAWRKRTQATSWYNETLNTATRGSRKEFPAVAVIVAEATKVTIYDGDDPDLPLWMVFTPFGGVTVGGLRNYLSGSVTLTSISMVNASLAVGSTYTNPRSGIEVIDFILDTGFHITSSELNTTQQSQPISERNTASVVVAYPHDTIINRNVNDVAMTVLPNAPTDAATGLPVPTIAIASDGGVSVIKDDGTVVDIVHSDSVLTNAVWLDQNVVIYNAARFFHARLIPDADVSAGLRYVANANDIWFAPRFASPTYAGPSFHLHPTAGMPEQVLQWGNSVAIANSDRLNRAIVSDTYGVNNALANFTTSTYNTGWMNGDIKLATLSDTDATNVTGAELVTNGTFDTDTSGWTGYVATLSNVSSALRITLTGNNGWAYQSITTVIGKTYTVSFDLNAKSVTTFWLQVGTTGNADGTRVANTAFTSTGSHSVTFTATTTTSYVFLRPNGASGSAADVDNVSVRLAEEDRSVNGNGLQVFGTVTKTAVATGADLVGYSGFSSSNYLQLPAGSMHLTGEHCFIAWVKTTGTSQMIIHHGQRSANKLRSIFINASGNLAYATYGNDLNGTTSVNTNAWTHVVGLYDGSQFKLYVNGVLDAEAALTPVAFTDVGTLIGLNNVTNPTQPFDIGSLALLRISATAPSAEQIAKIYNDEKVLFQENAQATLYGTSDAVTALAHDDTTDLLHVGTSAGRSVFQGLRRAENTTDAVGAAISASNGLVVEE
jgi:hypothetical protein